MFIIYGRTGFALKSQFEQNPISTAFASSGDNMRLMRGSLTKRGPFLLKVQTSSGSSDPEQDASCLQT